MEKRFSKTSGPCRIAITGPESTGKSILTESLARYFETDWVSEYAREYLKESDGTYEYSDIVKIAMGQIRCENAAATRCSGNILFCDTEMIVTKIWSEFKYQKCDSWILDQVERHRYDLYLLCDIDLPWEFDPLREHPDRRKDLFRLYLSELKTRDFPFGIVRGTGPERMQNALRIIKEKTGIEKIVKP